METCTPGSEEGKTGRPVYLFHHRDYIGTDNTGNAALGNDNSGVYFFVDGGGNSIGGAAAKATCVISSNGTATAAPNQPSYGVDLTTSTGETVQNDIIGLGADGKTALGNRTGGINGRQGNTVINNQGQQ